MSASGFGERLRRAREVKGISLEQISAYTRISARFLRAIEEEDLEHLPGGLFNKSFLRQYSHYLGVEDESFVQEYLRLMEPRRDAPGGEKTPRSGAERPKPDSASWPPHWALGAALAALALVAIFYFTTRSRRPDLRDAGASSAAASQAVRPPQSPAEAPASALNGEPDAPPATPAPAVTPSPAATQAFIQSPAAPHYSPFAAAATPGSSPGAKGLVLQINAVRTAWVSVTVDGNKKWQATLQPNESRQVQAADSIQVTLGNAGAVEMTLNGQPMGSLGREGQVKTLTLAASEAPAAGPER